mgnify:CR=1 FL=1
MPLISMRQLLDYAAENDFGMPAFNVNNMEQVHAIMQAAAEVDSPVIMQGSAGARSYAGEPFLRHLITAATEMYPHIPIVMHQDHGSEPAVCLRSIQSGFTSVMMDGSLMPDMKTPATFEYNVEVTRQVVGDHRRCHALEETYAVKPKLLINAAGSWIDFANRSIGLSTRFIGGTKGSHLVLDHPELREAIGDHEFLDQDQQDGDSQHAQQHT